MIAYAKSQAENKQQAEQVKDLKALTTALTNEKKKLQAELDDANSRAGISQTDLVKMQIAYKQQAEKIYEQSRIIEPKPDSSISSNEWKIGKTAIEWAIYYRDKSTAQAAEIQRLKEEKEWTEIYLSNKWPKVSMAMIAYRQALAAQPQKEDSDG